ncbi:phage holin [Staphylococcus pettenkoferi]|uniref:phage holin n=1 Tax=Staphylococcus pettenkoferi TaxID=170573 RepID=UPI002273945C|nr:phage holin [Staphylococcus pettenkoferi]MCY1589839.1 phage holin [Staphylococcus pettenkoferi]MCY1599229.1 phage holin [Staphylococcus pettenkoferi]MCY1613797.1 phage holin [Staphylococcus pettenkoferi]
MKKINWQVRIRKKSFWVAIVSALAVFANNILQAFGLDYENAIQQTVNGVAGLLTILASAGIIIDPTTKGTGDSGIALTYKTPRNEHQQPVEYQRQTNEKDNDLVRLGTKVPDEFDTSEPFTDGSDEVAYDVAEYEDDKDYTRGASRYHDDEVLKESEENGSKSNETTSD